MRAFRFVSAAAVACGLAASAYASGTLTDGNATYLVDSGTGASDRTGTGAGNNNWLPDPAVGDQLFQNWWWYRVNGVNTREFAFSTRTSESYVGNTGTLRYDEPEGFSADITVRLTDGASPGKSRVDWTVVITNNDPGGRDLDLALFNYADFDLGYPTTSLSNDGAQLWGPGSIRVRDTVAPTAATSSVFFNAPGADAYRVGAFSGTRLGLTDTVVDNLANTGLPFGPGDFTGAWQWNRIIPAGGSMTFTESLIMVPEPASLALLALGGLALIRRR